MGLRRKTEKKAERAEERWQLLSEPEADNIPLSLELVELVSQIAGSLDMMERLVMGVDRIGKGLELVAERLGDRKEKEKERKNVEVQTEVLEDEETETESETDGDEVEEEKEDEEEKTEEVGEEDKEKEEENKDEEK